jgi:hypothetical protein
VLNGAAGSPQAQRIMILREGLPDKKIEWAKVLAGVSKNPGQLEDESEQCEVFSHDG